MQCYQHELAQYREHMTKDFKKAAKMEQKLSIALKGYHTRSAKLSGDLTQSVDELGKVLIELQVFETLRSKEEAVIPARLAEVRDMVEEQDRRNTALQLKYQDLLRRRDSVYLALHTAHQQRQSQVAAN